MLSPGPSPRGYATQAINPLLIGEAFRTFCENWALALPTY